ncbi:hypothetical protein Dimus_034608 [Dionaea muscipula]
MFASLALEEQLGRAPSSTGEQLQQREPTTSEQPHLHDAAGNGAPSSEHPHEQNISSEQRSLVVGEHGDSGSISRPAERRAAERAARWWISCDRLREFLEPVGACGQPVPASNAANSMKHCSTADNDITAQRAAALHGVFT